MKAAVDRPPKGQPTEVENGLCRRTQGGCFDCESSLVADLDKDAQTEIPKAVEAAVQKAIAQVRGSVTAMALWPKGATENRSRIGVTRGELR